MFKFKVLVQNKRSTSDVYYFRRGYIKAATEQEAINNLKTVFNGFNYTIDSIDFAI